MIQICCKNNKITKTIAEGRTLFQIMDQLSLQTEPKPICALVNNKVVDLNYVLTENATIQFLDVSNAAVRRIYYQGLILVFAKALSDTFPNAEITDTTNMTYGVWCSVNIDGGITADMIRSVKKRMQEIISADLPIEKHTDFSENVISLLKEKGRNDAVALIESRGNIYTTYYSIDNYTDICFGILPVRTGYMPVFDIKETHGGVLILATDRSDRTQVEKEGNQEKLLKVNDELTLWQKTIGISNIGSLNKATCCGKSATLINVAEALQNKKFVNIADTIHKLRCSGERNIKMVLIAGPSSSGKTTFSKKLQIQLLANNITPKILSLDDYYKERGTGPVDENGELDFESLYALDLELLDKDLNNIINGKEVAVPTYNFTTGKKEYLGNTVQITDNQVLIVEGIHALNPELTKNIPETYKFHIFVSALTSLRIDNHNYIHPTDNRLLRRILRDYQYRGTSAVETIERWPSVRAGEDKWILPYQERADVMVNSALLFELAVLKDRIIPILDNVPQNCIEYATAQYLLKFLRLFTSITEQQIPQNSLLREFIGGSSFHY